jgi:hypothetical protein
MTDKDKDRTANRPLARQGSDDVAVSAKSAISGFLAASSLPSTLP